MKGGMVRCEDNYGLPLALILEEILEWAKTSDEENENEADEQEN